MPVEKKGFEHKGFKLGQKVKDGGLGKGRIIGIDLDDSSDFLFITYEDKEHNQVMLNDSILFNVPNFLYLQDYEDTKGGWSSAHGVIVVKKYVYVNAAIWKDDVSPMIEYIESVTSDPQYDVIKGNKWKQLLINDKIIYRSIKKKLI